ncbi:MAG: chitobiase/beta-hexosaminidase C-terminal domain-containing protein, partial [Candidatus Cloacimonadaceae bacterium]|nr:chitobiase/beta-hexosaminidase C-terminal domain-containing protein [Candidatus Cloacimonadaceae bacterium]
MKKILIMLAVLLAAMSIHGQNLLYYWNFNTGAPAQDQTWNQPIAATVGNGQLTYTFTEAFSFTGTTINGIDGESNGGSFAPRGGIDNVNNGAYFTLTASTVGFDNIIVTYPTRRTSTGFTNQEVKYTVDGTNWLTKEVIDLSGFENNWVATQLVTIDFTGVPGVGNNANFAIRFILTGASSAVGNNRLDNIQIRGSSQGAVATPTFNPPSGTYSTPQNVTISCSTPSSTIYYTTDGTNPTTSSPVYQNPINVATTTTIKAVAHAAGLDPSTIATATYSFASTVSNLGALRAQPAGTGQVYTVTGEVILTFKQTFRNQKYVQDAQGAILIDDPTGVMGSGYNVYDGITGITGTIAYYTDMLQFT